MSSIYNPALRYRAEIDGLRAVAVLPVILFHAGFDFFSGGYVGVDVFFVISGFLITSIILKELAQGSFSILKFYERRARRILPALFFVIIFCFPFASLWLLPDELKQFGQSVVAVAMFASNIFFWLKTNYFSPDAENQPLLHTWSLAVEEQYYVFFPLFLIAFWRYGRARLFLLTAAVAGISLLYCEWAWRHYPVQNFYLLPTRAWELLMGSLVAFWQSSSRVSLSIAGPVREILTGVGLAAILISSVAFDSSTPFPSVYAAVPTLGTALIITFGNGHDLTSRILSFKPVVFIGMISYSAYLWHQPLFAFLRIRSFGEPGLAALLLAAFTSLVLATVSWQFVEKPFRSRAGVSARSRGFTRARIFQLSAAGLCFFALTGFAMSQLGRAQEASEGLVKDSMPTECLRLAALDNNRCPLLGNHDATRPLIVLWGDSYADVLAKSLANALQEKSATVLPLVFHSCPSLVGTLRNEDYRLGQTFSSKCSDFTERAAQLIAELRPRVVVLTSSYERYSSAVNPHDGRPILLRNGATDSDGLAVVLESLEDTVRFLNDLGIAVVLVTPHPKLDDFDHRRRMARIDGNAREAFELNAAASQRLSEQIDFRLAESGLRFRAVSPADFLCEARADAAASCSAVDRNGRYLLFDGSHLSLQLAQQVSAEIAAQIAADL